MSRKQAIGWNKHPEEYCEAAKQKAVAALHLKHSKGLTTLEKSYLAALKNGQVKNVTNPNNQHEA